MKILEYIYLVWALLVFTFFMIVLLPVFLIPALFGDRGLAITYFFLRFWAWIFSKLSFIPYEVTGKGNIAEGGAHIYVSNHTSYLDIPGLLLTIPGQFRPLAKKELVKLPVFGWIASIAAVIVDRSSHDSRVKSMEKMTEVLSKGIPVLIFPEGTQNRSGEVLQPFKDGAFRIALETKQSIVPIFIEGAGKLMPPGKFKILPGKIKIKIGEVIPFKDFENCDGRELRLKVFSVMQELANRPVQAN